MFQVWPVNGSSQWNSEQIMSFAEFVTGRQVHAVIDQPAHSPLVFLELFVDDQPVAHVSKGNAAPATTIKISVGETLKQMGFAKKTNNYDIIKAHSSEAKEEKSKPKTPEIKSLMHHCELVKQSSPRITARKTKPHDKDGSDTRSISAELDRIQKRKSQTYESQKIQDFEDTKRKDEKTCKEIKKKAEKMVGMLDQKYQNQGEIRSRKDKHSQGAVDRLYDKLRDAVQEASESTLQGWRREDSPDEKAKVETSMVKEKSKSKIGSETEEMTKGACKENKEETQNVSKEVMQRENKRGSKEMERKSKSGSKEMESKKGSKEMQKESKRGSKEMERESKEGEMQRGSKEEMHQEIKEEMHQELREKPGETVETAKRRPTTPQDKLRELGLPSKLPSKCGFKKPFEDWMESSLCTAAEQEHPGDNKEESSCKVECTEGSKTTVKRQQLDQKAQEEVEQKWGRDTDDLGKTFDGETKVLGKTEVDSEKQKVGPRGDSETEEVEQQLDKKTEKVGQKLDKKTKKVGQKLDKKTEKVGQKFDKKTENMCNLESTTSFNQDCSQISDKEDSKSQGSSANQGTKSESDSGVDTCLSKEKSNKESDFFVIKPLCKDSDDDKSVEDGADGTSCTHLEPLLQSGYGQIEIPLQQEGCLLFLMSHIESPSQFYIHQIQEGVANSATTLMNDLEDHFKDMNMVMLQKFFEPVLDERCAAKYSEDNRLYRAKVLQMQADKCEVYFVDFGNKEWVEKVNIFPLPPRFASVPPLAVCCIAADMFPVTVRQEQLDKDEKKEKADITDKEKADVEVKAERITPQAKEVKTVDGWIPESIIVFEEMTGYEKTLVGYVVMTDVKTTTVR